IPPNYVEASWDISKTPSPTYILARGNYLAPGAEVQPGIPLVLDSPQKPLEFPDALKHPEWNGTNRRLTLAKWMVSPDNPLVPPGFEGSARVPGRRPGRQAVVAEGADAPRSGNHPRFHAEAERPVKHQDVRQAGADQARTGWPMAGRQRGRRYHPPQPLPLAN